MDVRIGVWIGSRLWKLQPAGELLITKAFIVIRNKNCAPLPLWAYKFRYFPSSFDQVNVAS